MTPSEKAIWDEAFQVAIAACRDHVKFANKADYAAKVGEAFVTSIRSAKKAEEKKKAEAACPIVVRYSVSAVQSRWFNPENHVLRLDLPIAAQDWPVLQTREYVMPILQKKHPGRDINVRGVDWNPPPLQEIQND